ncbi:MAG TPA: sodium:solute symporter [Cyclobacteriaceae bacterium]|nr:sodium:solute symporter [Cyclobacteriaceae bacterium]
MSTVDWIILFGTLISIVAYGTWKTRGSQNIQSYLLGDNTMPWWTIGLSIMATQASAITFLSTPGQAFEDGMRFIQFYFGLPLAMIILAVTAVPIFYRLKVYTAYEYLEGRFDLKTRSLAAFFFLVQRGLAAAITIYAPSIILSSIIGMPLSITTILIGVLVIIYTVSGGTKAVSLTQKFQMTVMMGGMILAGIWVIHLLPEGVGFKESFVLAGEMGKLNLVNMEFNLSDRYNIWSGLIGGMFLALSYFGTDQSQVARYLGGKSITESRLGLLFNGLLKIPMQFIILFIGVLVFIFYQFYQPPIFYNDSLKARAAQTEYAATLQQLEFEYEQLHEQKLEEVKSLLRANEQADKNTVSSKAETVKAMQAETFELRMQARSTIAEAVPGSETRDTDYVFIHFVMHHLPQGIVGLLIAVIFSAAMSSTASELNALASTTTVDIYKRSINSKGDEKHYLNSSRLFTLMWGLLAILFASLANLAENLIQFVNIVGSIFYGTILGIFLAAFYIKYIKGTAVFIAAILAELIVLYCFFFTDIAYLLFNIIGCVAVVFFALVIQLITNQKASNKKGS